LLAFRYFDSRNLCLAFLDPVLDFELKDVDFSWDYMAAFKVNWLDQRIFYPDSDCFIKPNSNMHYFHICLAGFKIKIQDFEIGYLY